MATLEPQIPAQDEIIANLRIEVERLTRVEQEFKEHLVAQMKGQINTSLEVKVITYRKLSACETGVYLGGGRVGIIAHARGGGGFQYFPAGRKGGEVFTTLRACQKSLESD